MPTERKITVEIEGKKHEVLLPEGYVHTDELKDTHVAKEHFQTELQSRLANITKGLRKPEDLITDADFTKTFIEKRKDDLMKVLNITPSKSDIDVTKIQNETADRVRREELSPLAEKLKFADEEVGLLRGRDLDGQVATVGLDLGIDPTLMDLVKLFVAGKFGWDPERRQWFQKKVDGSEGFELSGNPNKGGQPYVGVREFLEGIHQKGSHKSWFTTTTQPGAGFRGTGSPKSMTVEQFQKLSPNDKTKLYHENNDLYNSLMAQIQSAGEEKLFAKR